MSRLFSVVICNFNHGAWLEAAVASALDQCAPAVAHEVIVVDDGSTDDSRERLAAMQVARPADAATALRVFHQAQAGQAGALYRGVRESTGDYVCLLDSDDLFDADKIQRVNDALDLHPELRFLIHNVRIRDEARGCCLDRLLLPLRMADGKAVVRLRDKPDAIHFPVPCGVVLRRDTALQILDAMPRDDWWQGADGTLNLATWCAIGEVGIIDQALATYRVHGANHLALIADGRLSALPRSHLRIPKRLAFVERLLDNLDVDPVHRMAAQEAIAQVARNSRLRPDSPSPARYRAQSESIALGSGDPVWPVVARHVASSSATHLHFALAGDQIHSWFHERMAHHHATLPAMVLGCDFAMHLPSGERLREHVLLTHGRVSRGQLAWPPFPSWHPWPLGPLSTLSIRVTPLVRAWVAHCDRNASERARHYASILLGGGLWALGGAAIVDEAWASICRPNADILVSLASGDALPDDPDCPPGEPFAWLDLPVLLVGFVIEAAAETRTQLPPGWIAALARWARSVLPTSLCDQLAAHADRARLPLLARNLRQSPAGNILR